MWPVIQSVCETRSTSKPKEYEKLFVKNICEDNYNVPKKNKITGKYEMRSYQEVFLKNNVYYFIIYIILLKLSKDKS